MSHVVTIDVVFNDLNAIEAACKRMGWEFKPGQKTFEWFGKWVGDYHGDDAAYTQMDAENFGKCDHAIGVPGADYEIGLVRQADGSFKPVWDFWCSGGLKDIRAENGMGGFTQAYSVEKTRTEMMRQGMYGIQEITQDDGSIRLVEGVV